MTDSKIETLQADFPILSHAHIMCGDGWYDLIRRTCEKITAKLGEITQTTERPTIQSIDRNHDSMRITMIGPEVIHEIARQAEMESSSICDQCGVAATPRTNEWGWKRTLCDKCSSESGFETLGKPTKETHTAAIMETILNGAKPAIATA